MKNTCNQCQKEMGGLKFSHIGDDYHIFDFCENPECPNYGLLQVSAEKMKEIKKNEV